MGLPYPNYPQDTIDGDDVSISPQKNHESLLAVQDGTNFTRRLVTDAQRRLKVVVDSITSNAQQHVIIDSDSSGIKTDLDGIKADLDEIALDTDKLDVALSTLAKASTQTDGSQKTQVTNFPSSQVVALADNFGRIKNRQFKDTETVLYDIPLTLVNAFTYVGVAAKGTAQTATSWNIIRTSYDANGNPSADQVALGIAWSARAAGPWS